MGRPPLPWADSLHERSGDRPPSSRAGSAARAQTALPKRDVAEAIIVTAAAPPCGRMTRRSVRALAVRGGGLRAARCAWPRSSIVARQAPAGEAQCWGAVQDATGEPGAAPAMAQAAGGRRPRGAESLSLLPAASDADATTLFAGKRPLLPLPCAKGGRGGQRRTLTDPGSGDPTRAWALCGAPTQGGAVTVSECPVLLGVDTELGACSVAGDLAEAIPAWVRRAPEMSSTRLLGEKFAKKCIGILRDDTGEATVEIVAL
mmetsp:Transcript_40669/g.112953  ORF Transcript_40669/g.112953 Transcript_40669/m.112953 type:complete len:260 (+) Transcript_40669:178-957(+)